MKVLITGGNGQLATDLSQVMAADHEIILVDRHQLDVCERELVMVSVKELMPDIIIHSAAYTNVDEAERRPDLALLTNALGTRNIALAAAISRAKLIYISTDYVFDGSKGMPYSEQDCPKPINVYGISKYAGELFIQSLHTQSFIVRTSWLYGGRHGKHFVSKIIQALEKNPTIKVVEDEIGSPTYTLDLARFIPQLMATDSYGIYHATNQGSCSRYEFAKAIVQEAGIQAVTIHPVRSEQYRLPAARPKYSVLDHQAVRIKGFLDLPAWQDALTRYMKGG